MRPFFVARRKVWPSVLILLSLLSLAYSLPAGIQARQEFTGIWAHDFSTFGCKPIIFIYAKETIAPGNVGFWVGPEISNRLKMYFGKHNVATEGVDYLGLIDSNFFVGGAPPVGIGLMQILLTKAATQCPTSKIVAAGYSQGAAVTHRAIQYLSQYVKSRIIGVVTFGDTQTLQDGGRIIGFPLDKTLIICNIGDVICTGTLYVFPIHLDYTKRVPEAVHWLIWKILSSYFNPPIKPWTPIGGWPGIGSGWWWPNATANATTTTGTAVGSMPSPTLFPDIPFGVSTFGGGGGGGGGGIPTPTLVPDLPDDLKSSLLSSNNASRTSTSAAGDTPNRPPEEPTAVEPPSNTADITGLPTPQSTTSFQGGNGGGCGAVPQAPIYSSRPSKWWMFWR